MSLIACGSIHKDHERFILVMTLEVEIFMCLAVLICEQFLSIHEWSWVPRCQSSPSSWRSFFFSVHSAAVNRVRTGPGKPGKSWNFFVAFSRTGKSWKKATGPGKFWKSV